MKPPDRRGIKLWIFSNRHCSSPNGPVVENVLLLRSNHRFEIQLCRDFGGSHDDARVDVIPVVVSPSKYDRVVRKIFYGNIDGNRTLNRDGSVVPFGNPRILRSGNRHLTVRSVVSPEGQEPCVTPGYNAIGNLQSLCIPADLSHPTFETRVALGNIDANVATIAIES
jgi:hypothetical protein